MDLNTDAMEGIPLHENSHNWIFFYKKDRIILQKISQYMQQIDMVPVLNGIHSPKL